MGLGIFALLAVWALWATADVVKARHDLLLGRAQAEVARTQATPANLEKGVPVAALRQASVQFHRAKDLLDSPSLFLARYLPVLGRQVQSARALSGSGAQTADVTAQALTSAEAALATHPTGGAGRLAQLKQVLTIAGATDRRLRSLQFGPRTGLIGSLATGRNQLTRDIGQVVTGLDRGTAAGQSLADLLSGDHRVLVLATNNAEMRAGSGMILELGVLQTSNGDSQLQALQSVNNFPIPAGAVKPPADLAARWGWAHPADDWDELLSSPRFDMTAPVAAQMWIAAGQKPVDAVMAIDPVLLADIVGVTGPVTAGTQTYTGSRIEPEVLHNQYAQTSRTVRQDQLGALAQAAFARFDAGGWSLAAMFEALGGDARGRHVMMWSPDAQDEAGWVRGGVGGVLTSKSLMVNILNKGRNKLDWFLTTSSTLAIVPRGQDTEVNVTVHLANATPPGQADEVVGVQSGVKADLYPGQQLSHGDYLGIVALSAPAGAIGLKIGGVAQPPIDGRDGPTTVAAAQYIVRQGSSLDVVFTFTLKAATGSMTVEPDARIPVMTWKNGASTWSGDHQKAVTW